jgi:hypothetical protein
VVVRANAGQGVTLSTTPGGSVSYICSCGSFDQVATFTASGCLTISDGDPNVFSADYLVVAGGGGGGTRYASSGSEDGGGGGAGGYRTSGYGPAPLQGSAMIIGAGCYPVTIGAGGAGATFPGGNGGCGVDSVFNGITSTGGGRGGTHGGSHSGQPGGSGGGGTANSPGGSGNTPPTSPPQGNNGGQAPAGANGGGGGGATGAGGNCGPAGAGAPNLITGSCVTYATGGTGGACGAVGGNNTGEGGDGRGNNNPAGAGGSGIVVVRFPSAACISVAPGTNTITNCVGPANDKVATFTVTGTLTVS